MWRVEFESANVEAEVEEMIENGDITDDDQAIIHAWIQQVSKHGPTSIRGENKWGDHELYEDWAGYRSSLFSFKGRIIYRIVEKKILIQISRITTTHNYKKKRGKK